MEASPFNAATSSAIVEAITYLESGSLSDIKKFIISSVLTGYIYNSEINRIEYDMRPLDDIDIIRFYLLFITMKKHRISPQELTTIKRGYSSIPFGDIEIYLPVVNGMYHLSVEEAREKLTLFKTE